ncbi:ABC transporter permease [Clostridium vincentii]|uniref:ABC-2 family transporter protein n=1 Tax=Clostridium vincentii TaxID=52704 RepID=A0A2T0BD86_9CLOT|nr:ABC transporter permease [Clostridium vincentii]PRR81848.1 ABC-2 family transporter protein [Clostridium vincentii]
MFLVMLKKEFKQLLRNKKNLILMFVFPIILITTLSAGLKSMMTSQDIFGSGDEYSKVYYTIEGETKYEAGFLDFKQGLEDAVNIKLEETSSLDNVKEDVDEYDALVHINVKDGGFELYSSKNGEKMRTKIFRSIFESVLNEYAAYDTIGEYNPKAFTNLVQNKYDEYVVKKDVDGVRDITSSEYYTFAELALIIFYVSGIVAESVYKETQLTTINRIRLSRMKESFLIGAKVISGIIIAILQTLLVYVYSTLVLDVTWGDNTLKFMSMFLAFGTFASVIGAIIGLVAKNDSTAAGVLSAVTIVICFLGGCYTPLSIIIGMSPINKLMYFSPIYWINTAIGSLLCGIESNAYAIALAVPLGLSALCLLFYFGILRNKGGLAND